MRATARARLSLGGALLGLGAAGALSFAAMAQDDNQLARRATLTVGQQLALDNGNLIGVMPLDLQFQTGTRAQNLQFSMSVPIEQGDPDNDDFFSFGDAQARLLYRRGARNSSFETELSYRQSDLDRDILYDELTDQLVTVDGGSLATSTARVGYVFGTQSKLGGEIGLQYTRRDYSDTTDAALYDYDSVSGDIRFYLEPTPLIRARILASASRTDSDGGTDTRSSELGVGASMQVDKLTNLDVEIAHSRIRREYNDGRIANTTGPAYRLNLTRSRPNGDWTLSYSSSVGTEGRRDNMMLGRSLEMQTYNLSAAIGATHFDGNYDPIYQISYSQELNRRSRMQASLRRSAITDADGDEAVNTDISASYSHQITELSSLNTSLGYRASDIQTGNRDNAETFSFDINYSHALNSSMSLVAGANVVRRSGGNNDTREDDERIYMGVNRTFNWLP
ncbi:hypothetical protein JJJ17_19600 [Paracoccus caeni]|uniref:TIGR03016 family PEP-CTERM system-associated outer membrane protein n=1 Tax=Paracoccus caeni TaxID=657651 RepID=A0A934SI90_9RHOB|nr:hypothetical protein [Paracoccus caeni]MBK4218138.1 hypothetical protein [Paracoccus caeni]